MKYLEMKLFWIVGVGPDCKHTCKTEAEEDYIHTHTHTYTHTHTGAETDVATSQGMLAVIISWKRLRI